MELGLRGKVAVVTGGSRGMGLAIAKRLAAEGARVAICARDAVALEAATEAVFAETGQRPLAMTCDLSSTTEIQGFIAKVMEVHGGVDILVSNVGGPPRSPFMDITDEVWEQWFQLTFMSYVRLVRQVVPSMRLRGGGHILTIGSNSSINPIREFSLSNSLRLGVWGLVRTLTDELGKDNIRATMLSPGRIATERYLAANARRAEKSGLSLEQVEARARGSIPLGRIGDPDEIANAVAFIVSDRAAYFSGSNFTLDGGLTSSGRDS
jgi:3-oxoacyl-[acyl-carrier protein] reductase